MSYFRYSKMLKDIYGCKVYKIPVNLPLTCPNRETGHACIFCGDKTAGFECFPSSVSIDEQINKNISFISKKYKADKFIIYLQNFTNTYMPEKEMFDILCRCVRPDVVEICLSTRPDCVPEQILNVFSRFTDIYPSIKISVELGLQTVNYYTLKDINRGHTLAEFIDAVLCLKARNIEIGVHIILNLPDSTDEDAVEAAKILSALKVNTVKIHSLYILKSTPLADLYEREQLSIISPEEYINRCCLFLAYLSPKIAVQRLLARAPEGDAVFCNWGMSWWKIHDAIIDKMQKEKLSQGMYFDYLNGAAWRHRFDK